MFESKQWKYISGQIIFHQPRFPRNSRAPILTFQKATKIGGRYNLTRDLCHSYTVPTPQAGT